VQRIIEEKQMEEREIKENKLRNLARMQQIIKETEIDKMQQLKQL